jgi:ferredoxin
MRIAADMTRCIGSGQCAIAASRVFDQNDADGLVIVLLADPPEPLREGVRAAVAACPSQALSIGD